jgi:uncharacterized cofD-like protein
LKPTVDTSLWRWLLPGLRVKRWLGLLLIGLFVCSLGASFIYVQLYRTVQVPEPASPLIYALTLQFIPHLGRGLILCVIGLVVLLLALFQLNASLISAVRSTGQGKLIDALCIDRLQPVGLKVVAIGGGTGLSSLLSGMKHRTASLTAVVTMADDGGSSGRLRRDWGIPPPGDLRHCITALADDDSLVRQLFDYRFGEGMGLSRHNFGNLFIAAMSEITGSFERAVAESSQVLAVRGRILPSTLEIVHLSAELAEPANGTPHVAGESAITEADTPIERVFLQPESARGYGEAIKAILEADLIVLGPGSLFTSILPNLLVNDIVQAVRSSAACTIYVCNVATQPGETDNYDVGDHIRAIERHVGPGLFDYVLANDDLSQPLLPGGRSELVQPGYDIEYEPKVVLRPVVDTEAIWRHDPEKLAQYIIEIHQRHMDARLAGNGGQGERD